MMRYLGRAALADEAIPSSLIAVSRSVNGRTSAHVAMRLAGIELVA